MIEQLLECVFFRNAHFLKAFVEHVEEFNVKGWLVVVDYLPRATISVMSSYCLFELKRWTSSTIAVVNSWAHLLRCSRKTSSKRSSPNSSSPGVKDSVTPSV